jgi:hypothetical protein
VGDTIFMGLKQKAFTLVYTKKTAIKPCFPLSPVIDIAVGRVRLDNVGPGRCPEGAGVGVMSSSC